MFYTCERAHDNQYVVAPEYGIEKAVQMSLSGGTGYSCGDQKLDFPLRSTIIPFNNEWFTFCFSGPFPGWVWFTGKNPGPSPEPRLRSFVAPKTSDGSGHPSFSGWIDPSQSGFNLFVSPTLGLRPADQRGFALGTTTV